MPIVARTGTPGCCCGPCPDGSLCAGVRLCDSVLRPLPPSVTFTITGPGGFSATCTTSTFIFVLGTGYFSGITYYDANCCVAITAPGVYTITASAAGYQDLTITATVAGDCPTLTVAVGSMLPSTLLLCATVHGCTGYQGTSDGRAPISGSLVTFYDADGGLIGSCTTDSSGMCCVTWTNPPVGGVPTPPASTGDYFVTITAGPPVDPPGYVGAGTTALLKYCVGVDNALIVLGIDPAYVCACCPRPVKRTMGWSDPYATTTLAYDDSRGGWVGCERFTCPDGARVGPCPDTGLQACIPQSVEASVLVIATCASHDFGPSYGPIPAWQVCKLYIPCGFNGCDGTSPAAYKLSGDDACATTVGRLTVCGYAPQDCSGPIDVEVPIPSPPGDTPCIAGTGILTEA